MDHHKAVNQQRHRRRLRVRRHLRGNGERPRLSVTRSHQHIYCQVINDVDGRTLCSASTREAALRGQLQYGGNRQAAALVGKTIAERAKQLGISKVCFDRGSYQYHGRVAALADAVRENGIQL